MNEPVLLLKAFFEALYELLESNRADLITTVEKLLRAEFKERYSETFDNEKYSAYRDAAIAFIEERIETYNPVGIQYTFDRPPTRLALELELQLNWYDSTAEYDALKQAIQSKAESDMTDARLRQLADELITELRAFPDRTIISAYNTDPALPKLPDYAVATAIEQIIST